MDRPNTRSSSRLFTAIFHPNGLIFTAYVLLALAATWPLVSQLSTHLYGGRSDLWVHQWTFWWVKEALAAGQSPFFTDLLYYPYGVPLYAHNFAWFNIALWLPLQAVFGSIAAYNLTILIILTLNGFCLYLLAYEFLGHRWAAFTAGLIFMLWPYTLSHYDHPNMIVLFWTPLSLLFLRRLLVNGRLRNIILAGVCLALLGLSRWQHLLMAFPLLAAFVLWQWWWNGRRRRSVVHLAATGIIAVLLMLPLALPVGYHQLTRDYPEDIGLFEPDNGRTDLAAYLIPSPMQSLWGSRIQTLFDRVAASFHYVPFIGFAALALALLGVTGRWPQARFWFLLALAYILLALGPELAVNGRLYPQIPMPYRLIHDTLIGDFIRRPHRLNLYLGVPMALLAGLGVLLLAQWRPLQHRYGQIAAPILLTLLLFVETNAVPFPTTDPTIPAWHTQLADEPGSFGLWELPMRNRSSDKWYMIYQTYHGKALVGGHISRMPREAFDYIQQVPLMAYPFANDSRADFDLTAVTQQTRLLAEAGIRYVVIHKPFVNEGLLTMWRDWFTYEPTYEDDLMMVYRTTPESGTDFAIVQSLTPEMGFISTTYAPQTAVQGGLIKVDGRWGTTAAPPDEVQVCLALAVDAGSVPPGDWHCAPPDANYPITAWQADEVVRGSYQLPIAETPPDDYRLLLALQDAESGALVGETADLGSVTVVSGRPATPTALQWDNGLQLDGYTLAQQDGNLLLDSFWQTPKLQAVSYKLFVHLINSADGQIVAQSDAVPRNWTYPTNVWEPGERVLDTITLPLNGVPPGSYQLWLGWYDEITGDRPLQAGTERIQLTTINIPNN
jgi:hypothetical protein